MTTESERRDLGFSTEPEYETPSIVVLGSVPDVTLGGPWSTADGFSGSVGNRGNEKFDD